MSNRTEGSPQIRRPCIKSSRVSGLKVAGTRPRGFWLEKVAKHNERSNFSTNSSAGMQEQHEGLRVQRAPEITVRQKMLPDECSSILSRTGVRP